MKFGHRAHNQPCVEARSGRCYQTSQNHGYAVDGANLPRGWDAWFANANDGTNEGIRHAGGRWRSVQFHPEAAPAPPAPNGSWRISWRRSGERRRVERVTMTDRRADRGGHPMRVLVLGSGALKIGEAGSSITPARRRSRR